MGVWWCLQAHKKRTWAIPMAGKKKNLRKDLSGNLKTSNTKNGKKVTPIETEKVTFSIILFVFSMVLVNWFYCRKF